MPGCRHHIRSTTVGQLSQNMVFFHVADAVQEFVEEEDPRNLNNSSVPPTSQDHAYSCVLQWYQQDRNDRDHIQMRKNIQSGMFVLLSVFSEYNSPTMVPKTIWVEVLAITSVKPTKQQCGNSIGTILLSPAVLHSLHIYDSNAKVCISDDTCPNPVFKAVHTVTLSRIIGQSYPNDEIECILLKNYFDIPHRRVNAGDMAVVPAAMVDNHWLVPDVQYYVYVVTQVDTPIATADNDAECNHHQHQLQPTQAIFDTAARGITKVVLKGRIHCRLVDSTMMGIYMKFLQWHETQRRHAHATKAGNRRSGRDGKFQNLKETNTVLYHTSPSSSQLSNSLNTSNAIDISSDNNKFWGYPANQVVQTVSPILDTLTVASFPSRTCTHRGGVSEATLGHLLRYIMIRSSNERPRFASS